MYDPDDLEQVLEDLHAQAEELASIAALTPHQEYAEELRAKAQRLIRRAAELREQGGLL